MVRINLQDFYPFDHRNVSIEVSDEVAAEMEAFKRAEASYERKQRRYKAYYTLDYKDGFKLSSAFTTPSPEEIYEVDISQKELLAALAKLPPKQSKRIYAHYFLGISKKEIAMAEGVSWRAIHESIQQGLIRMEKNLKKI